MPMCNGSVHEHETIPRSKKQEFMMSFNFSGWNVFKTAAGISAIGFAWFTFGAPESVNAASKSNICLIAFFASLALYYYSMYSKEREFQEQDGVSKRFDEADRMNEERVADVWRKVHEIDDKVSDCRNDNVCSMKKAKKSR